MGWIQRKISKHVDPQPEVKGNQSIEVLAQVKPNIYKVKIGSNIIHKLHIPMLEDKFWQYNISSSSIGFLLTGQYTGDYVKIEPVRRGSNDYKVVSFKGTWSKGDLICDEFMGNLVGGTLIGVYRRRLDNKTALSHPAANTTGDYRHVSTKAADIDDQHPVYGFGPYNPSIYNGGTSEKSINILGLNTGQVVSINTDAGQEYVFLVKNSYKETGNAINLVELNHDEQVISLSWDDLRGTGVVYSAADFDAHTTIAINQGVFIPKLFGEDVRGNVVDFEVSNDTPEITTAPVETDFEPQLLKF